MPSAKQKSDRLIIVSNRLPVAITKRKGKVIVQQSPGGLATALRALETEKDVVFVGLYARESQRTGIHRINPERGA